MAQLSNKLSNHGVTLQVTGVEPDRASVRAARRALPYATVRQGKFESIDLQPSFDVCCFSHSLYYVDDLGQALRKASSLLRDKGLIIAVCWSKNDDLYKLADGVFGSARGNATTAEDVHTALHALPDAVPLSPAVSLGTVDFTRWRSERSLAMNMRVISRGIFNKLDNGYEPSSAASMLAQFPDIGQRINGVVAAQKAAVA